MRTLVISLFCISFLGIMVSCGPRVLHTEFEPDAGPWPSGPLAGPPNGDSAQVQGEVIGNGHSVSLMSDSSASIDLITGEKPHNTDGYTIGFSGVKLTITEEPVIAIDALDAQDQLACGLEISGGEFRLISGNGENVIGNYTGQADQHNITMRLNLGSGTCGVIINQVAQGSGPNAPNTVPTISATAPLATSGFQELDRVEVAWEDTPGDGPTQYFLGHMTITKDD